MVVIVGIEVPLQERVIQLSKLTYFCSFFSPKTKKPVSLALFEVQSVHGRISRGQHREDGRGCASISGCAPLWVQGLTRSPSSNSHALAPTKPGAKAIPEGGDSNPSAVCPGANSDFTSQGAWFQKLRRCVRGLRGEVPGPWFPAGASQGGQGTEARTVIQKHNLHPDLESGAQSTVPRRCP